MSAASPGRHAAELSETASALTAGASSASRPCSRRMPNIWMP